MLSVTGCAADGYPSNFYETAPAIRSEYLPNRSALKGAAYIFFPYVQIQVEYKRRPCGKTKR